jgi:3',5'-cyclic AMP phosphodiesterase CpdA
MAERVLWAWVHVSDIHQGHGTTSWRYDQKQVLAALVADIPAAIEAGAPEPDAIICTGDVAATGALKVQEEYEEAEALIASLREASGAQKFFSVGGNHDVQRTSAEERARKRLLDGLREGRENLDDALADDVDRAELEGRFENLGKFLERLGAPRCEDGTGAWTHLLEHEEIRIRISGLNTALLSNDNADERRLRVSRTQLDTVFAAGEGADLTLVLGHHPRDWLERAEEKQLTAFLFKGADAYLHGHLHDPESSTAVKGTGQQLTTIAAGAVHGDEGEPSQHAYSFGALVEDDEGNREIRIWPRFWDEDRKEFIVDSSQLPASRDFARHPLQRGERREPDLEKGPEVQRMAGHLLAQMGRRRTAFPSDLSLAELHEQGLAIDSRLLGPDRAESSVAEAAEMIAAGSSVLALGPPGSGKTMLAFQVASALGEIGKVPLLVDLRSLGGTVPDTVADVVRLLEGIEVPEDEAQIVFVLDGIDEGLASGMEPVLIAAQLASLSRLSGLFVSCRDNDFERSLAASLPDSLFDAIFELEPWRVEVEFADFLGRLVEKERLKDNSLLEAVRGDEGLERLVGRPLLARMLTFVAEDGLRPDDASTLYRDYLGKLAAAAETSLSAAGCGGIEPLRLWREVAWHVFRNGLPADAVPIERLLGEVGGEGIEVECVYRALGPILDLEVDRNSTRAAFTHYSFFEYLLAQEVAERLIAAQRAGDPAAAAKTLNRDLPQEVRRHLVGQLRSAVLDAYGWPAWLGSVYREAEGSAEQLRTVRNLLAYLACRGAAPARQVLRELAESEADPFLQNSLGWALAREADLEWLAHYLDQLGRETELSSLNRGYLLYYFGDLPRSDPPFGDPGGSWAKTREQLVERFRGGDSYAETPAPRQALDLFTFYDFAAARAEKLEGEEDEVADALEAELREKLSDPVLRLLADKHERVRAG